MEFSINGILLMLCMLIDTARAVVVYTNTSQGITSLPPNIPSSVTDIDLSSNLFTSLGDNAFTSFPELANLNMGRNKIVSISASAFVGTVLAKLNLGYNEIVSFPNLDSIGTTLIYIDIGYNPVSEITAAHFQQLVSLETLILTECVSLPHDLAFLGGLQPSLHYLHMKQTDIFGINGSFCGLSSVTELRLSEGSFAADVVTDEEFCNLDNLAILELNLMGLTNVPSLPLHAPKLVILRLDNNHFPQPLDAAVFEPYTSLKRLYFYQCDMNFFPDISPLSDTLEYLDLHSNNISIIPDRIFENFTKIWCIDFDDNTLIRIPDLGGLANRLEELRVENNQLQNITCEQLKQFTNLDTLRLTGNKLSDSIVNALLCLNSPIQRLDLSSNQVTHLDSLPPWPSITEIQLSTNPIQCMRKVSQHFSDQAL